jgi:hypothetical protein
MFDANSKAVDYLYRALCHSEFDRVLTEDLACRIWEQLKNAHAGNAQVQARLFCDLPEGVQKLHACPR